MKMQAFLSLEMIIRKLKKNSVALDIVNFGEHEEGKIDKLEALLTTINNSDTNHIFHDPAGANAFFNVLIRAIPIFTGDGEGGSGFIAAAVAGGISKLVSYFVKLSLLGLLLATDEDSILRGDIYDRTLSLTCGRGRVTLLGDSIHAMQPNMGQRGCMAFKL
ncbi:26S proteasome non-ATPase regulatory subunit 4 homolog isoform X7 [Durio zibethinus]|uniref:26S proteasome non-ATPase regulatory subunit 4 homolog isoform X7 n=1 Tax=Durio zibethinus TaxID=66656 RepID=A0A6P5YTU4_DURZI|nr:26S proteasome non-ATPase regulatory subunit 4 homolog isoform X7 [Durio zibethinus]